MRALLEVLVAFLLIDFHVGDGREIFLFAAALFGEPLLTSANNFERFLIFRGVAIGVPTVQARADFRPIEENVFRQAEPADSGKRFKAFRLVPSEGRAPERIVAVRGAVRRIVRRVDIDPGNDAVERFRIGRLIDVNAEFFAFGVDFRFRMSFEEYLGELALRRAPEVGFERIVRAGARNAHEP